MHPFICSYNVLCAIIFGIFEIQWNYRKKVIINLFLPSMECLYQINHDSLADEAKLLFHGRICKIFSMFGYCYPRFFGRGLGSFLSIILDPTNMSKVRFLCCYYYCYYPSQYFIELKANGILN